ncbi:MAG: hypothetical protein PF487_09880 [Bacteroidales bacterium]|jgi:hypothetical protein|nr:hypothetical protein [Bacteroidales bacterium]
MLKRQLSKILQEGETGFGILIEQDAGYISSEINKDILNENFELKPNEPVLINCILQKWGVKNKNGRIYPKEVLLPEVNTYQNLVDTNSAVSEADHPDSSIISLQNISHMITKMWWGTGEQENVLFGQLKLIVSPGYIKFGVVSVVGDKIVLYLQNKIKLGVSSRGVGTLKEINGENLVQDDFELIGFDLVATPSTPGAYLFPEKDGAVSFSENYVNKNGILIKEEEGKINGAINKFLL